MYYIRREEETDFHIPITSREGPEGTTPVGSDLRVQMLCAYSFSLRAGVQVRENVERKDICPICKVVERMNAR